MNDAGRDVLVEAWARGHRQIKGQFHDRYRDTGECALGVLHLAYHGGDRQQAILCDQGLLWTDDKGRFTNKYREVGEQYEVSKAEALLLSEANDKDGWDFLTIARKIGV